MAINTGYAIAGGSATVVLPPYSAFGTELVIKRDFANIWLRKQPIFAMIKENETNWNKGSFTNGAGSMLLLPVVAAGPTTAAAGVTNANELTSISPVGTAGFSQAQFYIGHYRNAMWVKESEAKLINNVRGNHMQGKTQQLMDDFIKVVNADVSSANADAENACLGIQQPLSTSNTVGNISQSSVANWQSNVNASAGAFTLDLVDTQMDTVKTRNGQIKMMLFSFNSTNNVWGKLRASIAPAQRLVNVDFAAKYGFETIVYRDATCVMDNIIASSGGVILGLDPSCWYYRGDENPVAKEVQRYVGTDAYEHMYTMWAGIGTDNPAKNFRLAGISA